MEGLYKELALWAIAIIVIGYIAYDVYKDKKRKWGENR